MRYTLRFKTIGVFSSWQPGKWPFAGATLAGTGTKGKRVLKPLAMPRSDQKPLQLYRNAMAVINFWLAAPGDGLPEAFFLWISGFTVLLARNA